VSRDDGVDGPTGGVGQRFEEIAVQIKGVELGEGDVFEER